MIVRYEPVMASWQTKKTKNICGSFAWHLMFDIIFDWHLMCNTISCHDNNNQWYMILHPLLTVVKNFEHRVWTSKGLVITHSFACSVAPVGNTEKLSISWTCQKQNCQHAYKPWVLPTCCLSFYIVSTNNTTLFIFQSLSSLVYVSGAHFIKKTPS